MTDLGNEDSPTPAELLAIQSKEITDFALIAHSNFDKIWAKPSFHNEHHVQGSLEAVDAVFTTPDGEDPFDIHGEILKWNAAYPEALIENKDLLVNAFKIAFACHDLGNICADHVIAADGTIQFGVQYRRTGAEERSKIASAHLINRFLKDHPKRAPISVLVDHIIEQTKFGGQSHTQTLFWTVIQTIDQVGSAYFSHRQNEELVAGLIQEENGDMKLQLSKMIGFTNLRLDELFPDQSSHEAVVALFEQNTHGHTRKSFEFDQVLGDPNRLASLEDVPILLQVAHGKTQQSQTLV